MKPEYGRLLVVDDNEMNRDMLSRRLRRAGQQVAVAASGAQALQMLEQDKFDLVLLDIMMPEVSGLQVLQTLRQQHSVADLPVIIVTAKDQSKDMVEALEQGANDYVTKPIDFPVVNARVQTQLRLRRLAQLKDEFLGIASHDLKNPLASVKGFAFLVAENAPPGAVMTDKLHYATQRIIHLAGVMERIILDFLDFQAMDDGQFKLTFQPVDLNELARLAVESNAQYAKGKQIDLRSDLDARLPKLSADESRLQQVVDNYIGNAIKFSPGSGAVVVRTRAENGEALVEVSDSGPGLTEEDMQKVFLKYARLSSKPTGGEKSSGLGLAICKRVIAMHGGSVGARNNPQGGATFWFRLPLNAQPEGQA